MAKKQEQQIEDAVVVEETIQEKGLAKQTDFEVKLPAIPKKFYIKGIEYSLAVVSKLETEINQCIKDITGFDDKKGYQKLSAKKNEAVKIRTTLEKKRKEVTAPINAFNTNLKVATDEIGNAALKIQETAENKINEKALHEEELERQRLAKIQERTNTRMEKLRGLEGSYDPLNRTYSFEYSGIIINKLQLDEFEDKEWEETVIGLEAQQKSEKERKEREEKELQEEKDKLSEKQIKLRTKELNLNGAEFKDNAWWINGVSFEPVHLKELSDEEWDAKMDESSVAEVKIEESQLPPGVTYKGPVSGASYGNASYEGAPLSEPTVATNHTTISSLPASIFSSGINSDTNTKQLPSFEYKSAENIDDPLADVIAENVQAHEDHQAYVNGEVFTEIQFDNDKPFVEFHIAGTSKMRIFPIQFEKEATDLPDNKNNIIGTGQVGSEDLLFLIYKLPKR